jgi:hypothetical protein
MQFIICVHSFYRYNKLHALAPSRDLPIKAWLCYRKLDQLYVLKTTLSSAAAAAAAAVPTFIVNFPTIRCRCPTGQNARNRFVATYFFVAMDVN